MLEDAVQRVRHELEHKVQRILPEVIADKAAMELDHVRVVELLQNLDLAILLTNPYGLDGNKLIRLHHLRKNNPSEGALAQEAMSYVGPCLGITAPLRAIYWRIHG